MSNLRKLTSSRKTLLRCCFWIRYSARSPL
jgi:hypothetical protein